MGWVTLDDGQHVYIGAAGKVLATRAAIGGVGGGKALAERSKAAIGRAREKAAIPADIRPAKLGKMATGGANEETRNFLSVHPDAKSRPLPITPALKAKALDKLQQWRRSGDKRELDKVRSVLSADEVPPVIIRTYSNGNTGILDGWHRLAAHAVIGRRTIVGYELADLQHGR